MLLGVLGLNSPSSYVASYRPLVLFGDLSGYRYASEQISTVLESAQEDLSNDTHKPYIVNDLFTIKL